MDDIAIKVEEVYKDFKLPHEKHATLKSRFVSVLKGRKNKRFTKQHALKGVSFEVKKGEFFGIVGRNGSGKSTLLKMLAGIYQPTKGNIIVNGRLVPFIELGVGFNPELTGRENVYLNGAIVGFSESEVDAFYDEVVEFAELHDFMDQKLKNYSSGMQVRLAFSMAIRAKADILLIDEVLAVGDNNFQRKCFDYFSKIKGSSTTAIFVTHDMDAVKRYCDKGIVLEDNKVLDRGSADEIAKTYLKLFNTRKSNSDEVQDSSRWGDAAAEYITKKTAIKNTHNSKFVEITLTIKANRSISDPVFGFLITNQANQPLFGTNTKIKELEEAPLEEGETRTFSWLVPKVFNTGNYLFQPSIVYNGTMTVADWVETGIDFRIENTQDTPYMINPNVSYEKHSI